MKEWLNTHYIMIFFTDSKYQILDLPVSSPLGGPDFKQDILVGGEFFSDMFCGSSVAGTSLLLCGVMHRI